MTEQELNKACEWLDNTLPNIEYITNASALRQTKRQYIDTFRKTMEAVIKESLSTELTWQDMARIADIIGHTSRLTRDGMTRSPEDFYSEILKRFKEQ